MAQWDKYPNRKCDYTKK